MTDFFLQAASATAPVEWNECLLRSDNSLPQLSETITRRIEENGDLVSDQCATSPLKLVVSKDITPCQAGYPTLVLNPDNLTRLFVEAFVQIDDTIVPSDPRAVNLQWLAGIAGAVLGSMFVGLSGGAFTRLLRAHIRQRSALCNIQVKAKSSQSKSSKRSNVEEKDVSTKTYMSKDYKRKFTMWGLSKLRAGFVDSEGSFKLTNKYATKEDIPIPTSSPEDAHVEALRTLTMKMKMTDTQYSNIYINFNDHFSKGCPTPSSTIHTNGSNPGSEAVESARALALSSSSLSDTPRTSGVAYYVSIKDAFMLIAILRLPPFTDADEITLADHRHTHLHIEGKGTTFFAFLLACRCGNEKVVV
mmetsp:Transcript_27899/g.61051  ORF Transcript_27899/g.61051 Transcript_27899/m.61051 type:complete len:360 (+) Transcript_27899:233-1312(+)